MNWNDPSSSSIRDQSSQRLAYFRYASDGKQFALRLSGPPVGPKVGLSPLSASTVYYIKATWPDAERYRWIVYNTFPNAQTAASNKGDNGDLGKTTMPQVALNSIPNPSRFFQEQDLSERFAHVVSLREHETRDRFMFLQLHEVVRSAVGKAIPSLWFNQEDTEDDLNKEYDTSVMGKFACTNRNCHRPGWSSKMVPVWTRLYGGHRRDGYNAMVFNQRCSSCDCLGTLTLDEQSYVERVSYRLRKWVGAAVKPPLYTWGSRAPHVEKRCEGCKQGHCSQSQGREDEESVY
ncbi:zinc-binding domain-containing protein [Lasiosphaeria hispida]|uniref:Zinc-binding domain-containing protein n=1 Tax=Lasiosphaeria hispida TaxID=260671 RepID=A0AAJ0HGC1_9PEZI|nr:zinc-binding domain-containing protein [Lasiosphaeria hispida]